MVAWNLRGRNIALSGSAESAVAKIGPVEVSMPSVPGSSCLRGCLRGPMWYRIPPGFMAVGVTIKMDYRRRHIFMANVKATNDSPEAACGCWLVV